MLHVAVGSWTKILCLCWNFRKGDRDASKRNYYSSAISQNNMSKLYIAIHNWVIHIQHFKTKGGFPLSCYVSRAYAHINFMHIKNRGYVWKAMCKRKSWTLHNSYAYAWPFIHCLSYSYFIYVVKIYVRSHRKITHQWKSTLTDLINHEGTVAICESGWKVSG